MKKEIETRLWNQCTIEINLNDYISWEALSYNVMNENMLDEDVIYYSNAINYLMENDPSLVDSMELASDYGYELANVTSEILASILKSHYNAEHFNNFEDEITAYYDSLATE